MSTHERTPEHVTCPQTCMCLMMLLCEPSLSEWTVMSVCEGEKDMEEVSSPWFSKNGGYDVGEKEAGDIGDDREKHWWLNHDSI